MDGRSEILVMRNWRRLWWVRARAGGKFRVARSDRGAIEGVGGEQVGMTS